MEIPFLPLMTKPYFYYFKRLLGKTTPPFSLTLAITYLCQGRCRTCKIWKIYQKDMARARKELSFKHYTPLFTFLKNEVIFLNIIGGEPFLKPDLEKIINLATQSLPKLSFLSISTNGLDSKKIIVKTKRILKLFKGHLSLEVSLDGKENLNDKIRGIPGGYKQALETYRQLNQLSGKHPRLQVFISYTISNFNCGQFPEFFQIINREEEIGLERFSINFAHQGLLFHNPKDSALLNNDLNKLKRDVNFILENDKARFSLNFFRIGKRVFRRFYLKNLLNYCQNPKKMILPCQATVSSFFIDPYGDIYPCITWNKKLGNIKKINFQDFLRSPQVNETQKKINSSNCPVCFTPCESQISFLSNPPYSTLKMITSLFS